MMNEAHRKDSLTPSPPSLIPLRRLGIGQPRDEQSKELSQLSLSLSFPSPLPGQQIARAGREPILSLSPLVYDSRSEGPSLLRGGQQCRERVRELSHTPSYPL